MSTWDLDGAPKRGYLRPAYAYIKSKLGNNLRGAEIGICEGWNADYVLDGISLQKFYMIDPYTYFDFSLNSVEEFDRQYKLVINKYGKLPNVEVLRKTSEEASRMIPDGDLDFVYIDANHFYPYVKQDIDLWWPKVHSGGILCGHDYDNVPPEARLEDFIYSYVVNGTCYGVVKAVRDFAKSNNLIINSAQVEREHVLDWWIDK